MRVTVDVPQPDIWLGNGWSIQRTDEVLTFFAPGAWEASFRMHFPDKRSLNRFIKNNGEIEFRQRDEE